MRTMRFEDFRALPSSEARRLALGEYAGSGPLDGPRVAVRAGSVPVADRLAVADDRERAAILRGERRLMPGIG